MRRAAMAGVVVLLMTAPAGAQEFRVPLAEAVRATHDEERVRAWTLLSEGAASVAAGASLLAVDDPALRAAGVMTLSFGAVNAALAAPWLLRLPGERADTPGETDLAARLRRSRASRRSAAVLALNAGLDLLYIAAGITAMVLGARDGDRALEGGGAATLAQGGFLLAFDLWGWIASDANADRFTR
jgi:hypothetical protein